MEDEKTDPKADVPYQVPLRPQARGRASVAAPDFEDRGRFTVNLNVSASAVAPGGQGMNRE